MNIRRSQKFIKAFKKLPKKIQIKTKERIELFLENRMARELHDHSLKNNMKGKKAFSVTGDYRIIYEEEKDKEIVFIFIDIGTHSQVY